MCGEGGGSCGIHDAMSGYAAITFASLHVLVPLQSVSGCRFFKAIIVAPVLNLNMWCSNPEFYRDF